MQVTALFQAKNLSQNPSPLQVTSACIPGEDKFTGRQPIGTESSNADNLPEICQAAD